MPRRPSPPGQLLKGLPAAAALRERIASISMERSVLRQLLRIAVRREQEDAIRYAQEDSSHGNGGRHDG